MLDPGLTLLVAVIAFLQNIGTAYFLYRLPDDPMKMSSHLSVYSWFASTLSIFGVLGARKENATLVAIFANFLLIDVILCSIPRILTIFFFPEIRGSICSADSINARFQTLYAQGFFNGRESQQSAELQMMAECRTVILMLEIFAGGLVAGATLLQVVMALKVRAYSCMLQQRQDIEECSYNKSIRNTSEKRSSFSGLPIPWDEKRRDEKIDLDA